MADRLHSQHNFVILFLIFMQFSVVAFVIIASASNWKQIIIESFKYDKTFTVFNSWVHPTMTSS